MLTVVVVAGLLTAGQETSAGGFNLNEQNCSALLHIPPSTRKLSHNDSELLHKTESTSDKCPPWYIYDPLNNTCHFSYSVEGRVSYISSTLQTMVLQCYCMTDDSETHQLAVTACPYACLVSAGYYSLPCQADLVEKYTCNRFKRRGPACSECIPGYGPPIYSYTNRCVPCSYSDMAKNLIKYFTAAFLPLTLFTVCIIMLQIKATSPYLFSYIFFVQTVTLAVNMKLFQTLFEEGKIHSEALTKLGLTLLSIWNLDFFRMFYRPFCLQPSLNTLTVNFMDLLVALYPFVLIIFLALLMKLRVGQTRVCKILCRPIHLVFHHFGAELNMHTNLTSAFATFILLSNSKVVSIAFDMLVFVRVFPMDKTAPTKMTLFSSGNVEYFGKEHTPLALITMLVFITVVVLPVLLVLLYPLAFFQRALRKFNLDTATLRSFVNFFCDSYKTKEEDGTEYRWFPVSYFLLRIAIVLLYGATISSFFFPIEGVLLTAFVVFLGVCRPRKSEAHNAIDIFHMMWFLIFILGIMANITANSLTKRKVFLRTSVVIIVLATALPFLYIISLLLYFTYYKTRLNEVTKQLLRCSPAQRWLMPRKGYERIATHENINIHFEDENDGSEAHILVWKPKSYASIFN